MKVPSPPPRHVRDPAPADLAFRFRDGGHAGSLVELCERLRSMADDDAWFHRDHLAPWIRGVLRDEPLALRVAAYAQEAPSPAVFRELVADLAAARLGEL